MKTSKSTLILITILILLIITISLFFQLTINQKQQPVDNYQLTINNQTIHLTPAITNEQKSKGLMNITNLPSNQGMIFIYNQEQTLSFWMKNTLIPLDIIFLNQNYKVVDIKHNFQPCPNDNPTYHSDYPCPSYQSKQPAKYAIELNAGQANNLNIQIGKILSINK
ncbi:hypothetical protein CMI38_07205 [Candidatus Pacearchaeota archaeon]|jgi:hypothetical protein|nr:hypothetical protein [Candidatus Pacearchaeota archaeon]|tara:strand:- start:8012 stop:8509 length:498 start_codon:yes stop_codon:yes gene_type:complete